MEYATVVWSPYRKKDIFILENTQRRATKLVNNIKHLPYEQRLLHLGLPTLQYRRKRADLIQVYKIMNGIDKLDKNKLFNECTNTNTRGNSKKLSKGHVRLNLRANAFTQRVVNDWNRLPSACTDNKTINGFKSSLNSHWKHHPDKFHSHCDCGLTDETCNEGPQHSTGIPTAWRR